MKKFIIIFIFLTAASAFGQSKIGSTAAPFLNIGVGPRAISMGGAFTATANDISALYWNPAGASRSSTNEAIFAHSTWFADINYEWAAAMVKLGDAGTVGLNLTYLNYGEMEITTLAEQDGTGQMFSANDLSLGLTYAYNLTDRFSLGGTVKYVQQKIWNSSASAFAVDLGVLFLSDIYGLRIAATITNFGTGMRMDGQDLLVQHDIDPNNYGNNDQILASLRTDEFPLPLTFRIGLAMDVVNIEQHRLTLAVDALHPNDNDESINIGGEYMFNNLIAFRLGYKSLFLSNSEEGFTAGVGLNYDFASDFGVRVDYAYQDFGVLDYTQHFSLGVKF
ncbi:MAG: PorV/PorQ family protein [Ignavibacteriota bacterium]|nr:PorV/PorQ family protein [Ignavibacteriales bacterium]MCC7093901.1 PorV/PorQ family protein [Ignavibacteriaceae bacterium]MEB2296808.1 PorV/PorQ family protein [Ignavibacteria bacterium]QKJ96278.1 MAG: PorV/PorQ family protein [Ignavibacteriota bacterium]NUM60751.1 PorV/PorQ family protein [Ignavibacteriaceae bacterium]